MTRRKRDFFLVVILLLVVGQACVVLESSAELPDPPSWKGLVPGVSTQQDVLKVLGEPNYNVPEVGEITPVPLSEPNAVWSYRNSPEKFQSKLWYTFSFKEGVVYFIEVAWSGQKWAEVGTLEEIVVQYGKPYYVTWGDGKSSRWLAWPRYGILADAFANPDLGRAWVGSIIYTTPMTEREFDESIWPVYLPDERPRLSDGKPKDPFDWSGVSKP